MKQKKANLLNDHLKLIVLTVLIFIVMLTLFNHFRTKFDMVDYTACKASIEQNRILHYKGIDFNENQEINCPTKQIVVDSSNENDIYYTIAEDMKFCWDLFGKGQYDLYDEKTTFCHICSVFEFQDDKKSLDGLNNYLYQKKVYSGGPSYLSYLSGFTSEDYFEEVGEFNPEIIQGNVIDTNKLYSTIFVYTKGESEFKKISSLAYDFVDTKSGRLSLGAGVTSAIGVVFIAQVGVASVAALVAAPVILAIGAVAGVAGVVTYSMNEDVNPEYASILLFREYNQKEINDLGCDYILGNQ